GARGGRLEGERALAAELADLLHELRGLLGRAGEFLEGDAETVQLVGGLDDALGELGDRLGGKDRQDEALDAVEDARDAVAGAVPGALGIAGSLLEALAGVPARAFGSPGEVAHVALRLLHVGDVLLDVEVKRLLQSGHAGVG